jgi:hypothetical protein
MNYDAWQDQQAQQWTQQAQRIAEQRLYQDRADDWSTPVEPYPQLSNYGEVSGE